MGHHLKRNKKLKKENFTATGNMTATKNNIFLP